MSIEYNPRGGTCMNTDDINARIEAIFALEKEAELLRQQADALRAELKKELDNRKVDSLNTGMYNLVYKCYEKRSVDVARLKEWNLYDDFSKTSTVIQFRINRIRTFS